MGWFDAFDFGGGFDLEGSAFGLEVPTDFSFALPNFDLEGSAFGSEPLNFGTSGIVGNQTDPLLAAVPEMSAGGGYEGGYFYDTASDQVVDPTGQRTSLADVLRGGPEAPGREIAPIQAAAGAGVGPGEPGLFERGGLLGARGAVDEFLRSGIGGAATTAGMGIGGLLLSRALAGQTPKLRLPAVQPSAATTAGQNALLEAYSQGLGPELAGALRSGVGGQRTIAAQLADRALREALSEQEQAPAERMMRLQALGLMPGFLPGGPPDEVAAGVRAEALRALSPTYRDPIVEEAIRRKEDELRNALFRQFGSAEAAGTSTPGIDIQLQAAREAGLGQSAARRAAIGAYAPLQQELTAGVQGLRRQNLADVERLSRYGIRGVPETQTGLQSIAPIQPLLGLGGAENAATLQNQLQAQQALTAYGTQTQQQRELASAIGGLFGKVGEVATRRRSPLEDYLAGQGYYG